MLIGGTSSITPRFSVIGIASNGERLVLLLGHSKHVNLAAVQPILEFFMRRFHVMFACQVKMQKDIVYLVEQRFICFVALASFLSKICGNAIPPILKFAYHALRRTTTGTLTFHNHAISTCLPCMGRQEAIEKNHLIILGGSALL